MSTLPAELHTDIQRVLRGVTQAEEMLEHLAVFLPSLGLTITALSEIAAAQSADPSATQPEGALVCTTLPSGDLRMRPRFLGECNAMSLESECGLLRRYLDRRYLDRRYDDRYLETPVGAWAISESRIASDGERWVKFDSGVYYVVDNFGDLVRVTSQKGGAA